MFKKTRIVSSTHEDLDGDVMAPEAIHDMCRQFNEKFIPINIEHDPLCPPVGRVESARVVDLGNGHLGVEATILYYEPGDDLDALRNHEKSVALSVENGPGVVVSFDRSYGHMKPPPEIAALGAIPGVTLSYDGKKGTDPISTLVVGAGVFAVAAFSKGFFGALGKDAYEALKGGLKRVFEGVSGDDKLLIMKIFVDFCDQAREVDLVLKNPSASDIDWLLGKGLFQIEQVVPKILEHRPDIAKIVAVYEDGTLQIQYGMTTDALPLLIDIQRAPDIQ